LLKGTGNEGKGRSVREEIMTTDSQTTHPNYTPDSKDEEAEHAY